MWFGAYARQQVPMRSAGLQRPLSRPPVSNRDLGLYADMWVLVRDGSVILHAHALDAIRRMATSGAVNEGDAIYRLPPGVAKRSDTRKPTANA